MYVFVCAAARTGGTGPQPGSSDPRSLPRLPRQMVLVPRFDSALTLYPFTLALLTSTPRVSAQTQTSLRGYGVSAGVKGY